jgi:hypothetical protein
MTAVICSAIASCRASLYLVVRSISAAGRSIEIGKVVER